MSELRVHLADKAAGSANGGQTEKCTRVEGSAGVGLLARELPLLLRQLRLFRLLPEHVMITGMLQADLCGLSLVAVSYAGRW